MSFFRKKSKKASDEVVAAAAETKAAEPKPDPAIDATSIGNLLVRMGTITHEQLQHALAFKEAHREQNAEVLLGAMILQLGLCKQEQVALALELQTALRSGDAGSAALSLMEMRLEQYGAGERRIALAIEGKRAEQRAKGENSGLWLVPHLVSKAS